MGRVREQEIINYYCNNYWSWWCDMSVVLGDCVLDELNGLGTSWKCWMDAALKIIIGLFGSIRWFCVSIAHLMNLGTSWLGFGRVEWVRNELKVLNGCSIKNNYRFIWFNSVILCLQSTFNEFGDQLTGFWTSWTGPKFTFSGSPRHDVNGQPIVIIESSVEMQ